MLFLARPSGLCEPEPPTARAKQKPPLHKPLSASNEDKDCLRTKSAQAPAFKSAPQGAVKIDLLFKNSSNDAVNAPPVKTALRFRDEVVGLFI